MDATSVNSRLDVAERVATTSVPAAPGFSMIELLLAMLLVGVVLLAYAGMSTQALLTSSRAAQYSPASVAGQAKLEELLTLDYAAVVAGRDEVLLPDGRRFARVWKVSENDPLPGAKTVKLAVQGMNVGDPTLTFGTVLSERFR